MDSCRIFFFLSFSIRQQQINYSVQPTCFSAHLQSLKLNTRKQKQKDQLVFLQCERSIYYLFLSFYLHQRVHHMIRHPTAHWENEPSLYQCSFLRQLESIHRNLSSRKPFRHDLEVCWEMMFRSRFQGGSPLKLGLFCLKCTLLLLYIFIPGLMAPGNVWSQMESCASPCCSGGLRLNSVKWKRYKVLMMDSHLISRIK